MLTYINIKHPGWINKHGAKVANASIPAEKMEPGADFDVPERMATHAFGVKRHVLVDSIDEAKEEVNVTVVT